MRERKTLVRKEVINYLNTTSHGSTKLIQPLSLQLVVLFFAVVFFAVVYLVAAVDIKDTVRVRGVLAPKQGLMKVYPPAVGTYTEILVKEGQFVSAGTPLAKIQIIQQVNSVAEQGLYSQSALIQQRDSLGNKINFQTRLHKLKLAKLEEKIASLEQEKASHSEQYLLAKDYTSIEESNYGKLVAATVKGSSTGQVLAAYQRYIDAQQQEKAHKSQINQIESQLVDYRYQLASAPILHQQKLLEISQELDQLAGKILYYNSLSGRQIVAPVAGVVSALRGYPGGRALPQTPLLVLLPESGELEAELYVPSFAIGPLKKNQDVLLAYDAYPEQSFGRQLSRIVSISDAVVDPRESPLIDGSVRQPVYIVRTELKNQRVGSDSLLLAGMGLTAEIVTQKRSILSKLFRPPKRG